MPICLRLLRQTTLRAFSKEKARSVVCLSNLKQIGIAVNLYAHDHADYLVPAEYDRNKGFAYQEGWPTVLVNLGYLAAFRATNFYSLAPGRSVFQCPSG